MANTKTTSGGLNFTYPAKGRANFSALFDTLWAIISAHDHTGSGNGKQLSGSAIAADSIDDTHIELNNDTYLEWANNAGSGTINGWKVTTGDILQAGAAIDFNSEDMTNVDINSGTIDGVTITGGSLNSAAIEGGTIGTSTAVTDLRVDNLKLDGNTLSSTSGELTLADANANEILVSSTTASAVNYVEITNAATAGDVVIASAGDDTNVGLDLKSKGTGELGLFTNGSEAMNIDSDGIITKPLQPAFLASNSSTDSNVTGDGTAYTCIFDSEAYDNNADYNSSTGVFTAPVAGRYLFNVGVLLDDLNNGTTHDNVRVRLVASVGPNYVIYQQKANPESNQEQTGCNSAILNLAASETVHAEILVDGGTKIVDFRGDATNYLSWFGGELLG